MTDKSLLQIMLTEGEADDLRLCLAAGIIQTKQLLVENSKYHEMYTARIERLRVLHDRLHPKLMRCETGMEAGLWE